MRKPFYVKSRKAWYVWIDGKQHKLGTDKKVAHDKFHELMTADQINGHVPVIRLLDSCLQWIERNRSPKTFSWYSDHLNSFASSVGARLTVAELKPLHVTKWLEGQAWGDNTKHRAIAAVQRAFNWARKQGYIVRTPLEGMEKPEASPRDVVIEEKHFRALVLKTRDQAGKDFWTFLWETGCRVQEAKMISSEHFQPEEKRLVIPRKKAKGKKKARVIYLNPVSLEIVERRLKAQGDGHILLNRRNKSWGKEAIKSRAQRDLKPFNDSYCPGAFRHSFCTRALMSGVDPVTVSELMGHSNLSMVANNYSHLCKKPDFLQEQLAKVK